MLPFQGQVEEATVSDQDIHEDPGSICSGVVEADRLPNLHGLTGSMGQIVPKAITNKLLGQMEPEMATALTEDQRFTRGQSPDLVVG